MGGNSKILNFQNGKKGRSFREKRGSDLDGKEILTIGGLENSKIIKVRPCMRKTAKIDEK